MADLKISQLTAGDPAQAADQIPINRGGANFRITAGSIAALPPLTAGANQVLFVDAAGTSVDGNANFVYTATGLLGLGTASPQNEFEVAGNSSPRLSVRAISEILGNNPEIGFQVNQGVSNASSNTLVLLTAVPTAVDPNPLQADLTFGTNSGDLLTEKMRLTAAGNLGIATTAPTNTLSFGGNGSRTIWMERHTAPDTIGNTLTVQAGGATNGATDKAGGNLLLSSGISTGSAGSAILFNTASAGGAGTTDNSPSEKMRLTAAGDLGLGVTPSGAFTLQTGNGYSNFKGANFGGASLGASGSEYSSVGYNVRYQSVAGTYLYNGTDTANLIRFTNGQFQFLQAASGSAGTAITFTQAMTLDSSGALTLGTTQAVTGRLRVVGTFRLTDAATETNALLVTTSATATTLETRFATPLIFGTNAVERLRISNTGLLQFAGTTSAFPALKRVSAALNVRLADDSADAALTASELTASSSTVNLSSIVSSGYSLTGSAAAALMDLSGTWNTTGTPTGIKLNITDTASNAASLLMDLQTGGVSRFSVSKGGTVTTTTINASGNISAGGNAAALLGGGVRATSSTTFGFSSTTSTGGTADTLLSRKAAASLQLGEADAAAPVAQTIGPQSVVAGTSNTAGANFTIRGSQGTGTGVGGDIIVQTAPAGGSGTAQNALAERMRVTGAGSVVVNNAAIATNATDGFLYVPSCAGTPTGTPTAFTGRIPIVVDSTNNKLYFYSGGAWRDAGP